MRKLLLVDDDDAARHMMSRALRREGYCIDDAESVDGAMQWIQTHQYDAAVLDLKIGSESGLNLIEPLRKTSDHCRILLLTGYSSIATAVAAIKLGADDYLCKPASTLDLLKALGDAPATAPAASISAKPPSVNRMEWEHIQRVLAEHDGNISATARSLGMHRRTLQRKLQKRPVNS